MHQNITLKGRRDSVKIDSELGKVILIIWEILWIYYGIESTERIETLRIMFRIPYAYLLFYFLSLDFFGGISRKTAILISYGFLCFTACWYKENNSVKALFNMLAASKSCENICCFDQSYQPDKITLQDSVLIIKSLVAVSFG